VKGEKYEYGIICLIHSYVLLIDFSSDSPGYFLGVCSDIKTLTDSSAHPSYQPQRLKRERDD